MYRKGSSRDGFILAVVLLVGLVLGGFIGEAVSGLSYLRWLGLGRKIGLMTPAVLDLGVVTIQFALSVKLTVAGAIGLIAGYILYKKL